MGRTQNCSYGRRLRHVMILMFLLLGSMLFPTEGRVVSGLAEADELRTEGMFKGERKLIGSSPPRCERRCSSCGRQCEAVQVPIVPQQQQQQQRRGGPHGISRHSAEATPRIASSRGGDDVSNYKPMAWKCKCGNLLFNP